MNEDMYDALLRELLDERASEPPPLTPDEDARLWAGILARVRQDEKVHDRRVRTLRRATVLADVMAATLVLAIGIDGRMERAPGTFGPAPSRMASTQPPAPAEATLPVARVQLLDSAAELLIAFQRQASAGTFDPRFATAARWIVQSAGTLAPAPSTSQSPTDASGGPPPQLLDDVIAVLGRIAQYSATDPERQQQLREIQESIAHCDLMQRLPKPPARFAAGT